MVLQQAPWHLAAPRCCCPERRRPEDGKGSGCSETSSGLELGATVGCHQLDGALGLVQVFVSRGLWGHGQSWCCCCKALLQELRQRGHRGVPQGHIAKLSWTWGWFTPAIPHSCSELDAPDHPLLLHAELFKPFLVFSDLLIFFLLVL